MILIITALIGQENQCATEYRKMANLYFTIKMGLAIQLAIQMETMAVENLLLIAYLKMRSYSLKRQP
ncbi:hypothetical protein C2134_03055 [Chromobacterium sinusclupearum]|uniref:Uncharacterized protein n=1 Tax=Chromobacterium sinusclupearum TaxID=2077146 RepID=A0A2K4MSV2_9NEIS|nr:hypothetical protein C2134_03055 [Chromobacterium sinusclupearum]